MIIVSPYIPKEKINIILDYDGRIKFREGKYINIIAKYDIRYNIIQIVIIKKKKIIDQIKLAGSNYYFHFNFIIDDRIRIYFDVNKF